jgi:secondary thiamine-phosphate synthase enzyme
MVHTARHRVSTKGQRDAHDITGQVAAAVAASTQRAGVVTVFVIGSTAVITTIEFKPGAIADLNDVLETMAPRDGGYAHHARWGDDNGSSHVRAALMGPSIAIPFVDGELALGTWQQVMLLECDTRARTREIVIQVVGE